MNCETARQQFGAYADGELPPGHAAEIEQHIDRCTACAAEFRELREMLGRFADTAVVKAPAELWSLVERRLDGAPPGREAHRLMFWSRRLIVAAASIAILVGGGVLAGLWFASGTHVAQADEVNFALLLDGLAADVDGAFARFLKFHRAEPIDAEAAASAAPGLRFAIPSELPGGFQLRQAYRFQLGSEVGLAAAYHRGREPMLVFFHRPTNKEHHGIRTETSCVVEGHEVHTVEVGLWRLAHFTDPTTCHCVLSTLNVETELPAVFAAVAPEFKAAEHRRGH
jgi:hypothetical protein